MSHSNLLFVEYLTVRVWFFYVWPALWKAGRSGRKVPALCYCFEGSRMAFWCARLLGRLSGTRVEWLSYRLIDVRDEKGLAIIPKVE